MKLQIIVFMKITFQQMENGIICLVFSASVWMILGWDAVCVNDTFYASLKCRYFKIVLKQLLNGLNSELHQTQIFSSVNCQTHNVKTHVYLHRSTLKSMHITDRE